MTGCAVSLITRPGMPWVALALGLHVARVEIFDTDYSGGADVAGADSLSLVDQIAVCVAGVNANHMFKAPSHELAAFSDHAAFTI
jgi:hypothetical protein